MNSKQQSYYYTFGTSATQPYKRGWVEVKAQNRSQADALFRLRFPDRTPGVLNCSSVYDQSTFQKLLKERPAESKDWNICHETIALQQQPQMRTPQEVCQFLLDTKKGKDYNTVNLGITMFNLASSIRLRHPLSPEELEKLAGKINDCWLSGTRTIGDVEYAVYNMLETGSAQIEYADDNGNHVIHPEYSPDSIRSVLLNCDMDTFHFLINTELGNQPTTDTRNPDGSKTILGETMDALDEAEKNLAPTKEPGSLADKIRNAEERSLRAASQQENIRQPERQGGGRAI